jgi:hypothetical protein
MHNMPKPSMISTPLLKLITSILCFLLVVSTSAMTNYKYGRSEDRMFQIPLDTFSVSVSQNSKYLMPGQAIEITVQVCGNKDRITKISIGNIVVPLDKSGTAVLKQSPVSIGIHKINVEVTFIDVNNNRQVKTYTIDYEVGQPCTSIDEGNLNLLYIGIDNPLYISGTGGTDEKITVTSKGGGSTITKSKPGMYIVRVSTVSDKCIISVFTDNKMMGAKIFRVLNLPVPEATIGDYISGSRISANEFLKQPGIKVAIEGFPFAVNYKVVGYTIKVFANSTASKSFKSSGSQLSPDFKKYISQVKPGTVIVIDDITVEESTVRKVKLPALVYFID